MPQRRKTEFRFDAGYVDSQAPDGPARGTLAPGSSGLYPSGDGIVKAMRSPSSIGITGANHATVVSSSGTDVSGGIDGSYGSIFGFKKDGTIFIGDGTAYVNGVSIGTATNEVKLRRGGSTITLGIPPPGQPSEHTPQSGWAAGKCTGTYSFKITATCSLTGGESNPSPASSVILTSSKKIQLTIPNIFTDGVDGIRVYCSFSGFGAIGPWYAYAQEFRLVGGGTYGTIQVDGGGAYYVELDFYDGDLLGLSAPYAYFEPPTGTHAFMLGPHLLVAGCYDAPTGFGIAPSLINKPDSYDPDHVVFLNPGGKITACTGRATDGFQYVATANSLHGVILSGVGDSPILARVLWGSDGFPSDNAMCYVDTELWGVSSNRGPVRTQQGSEPDRSFARAVGKFFDGINPANVVVGYDAAHNHVVFAEGTQAIAYMRGEPGNKWSAPFTLPAAVESRVSLGGVLHLVLNGTLYRYMGGSAGDWVAQSEYSSNQTHEATLTEVGYGATADCAITLLKDNSGVATTVTASAFNRTHGDIAAFKKINVPQVRSHAVRLTGSGDVEIHGAWTDSLVGIYRA